MPLLGTIYTFINFDEFFLPARLFGQNVERTLGLKLKKTLKIGGKCNYLMQSIKLHQKNLVFLQKL